MKSLEFRVLSGHFAVTRLEAGVPIPDWLPQEGFSCVVRTPDETSIVCPESVVPPALRTVRGWRCVGVVGPLDFSLVGILAGIASTLAAEQIPIFAISTFDTDYLLIKGTDLERALRALRNAGHRV